MLLLTREDVRRLLDVDEVIEAVNVSFHELATGNVQARRSFLDVSRYDGVFLAMSSHVKGVGGVGLKVVTAYKQNNQSYGLPTVLATIFLFNPTTGALIAVMEGSQITALRTAAGSALATKHLSRPDSRVLGIIGTGVQARTHLASILRTREITRVLVYGLDAARTRAFIDEVTAKYPVEISAAESIRRLVEASDIVVTATTSGTPVFEGEWLRPGTHINSIMTITPVMRELDDLTVSSSRIFVDDLDSALHEAGDIIQPLEKGLISMEDICSLGEIIAGRKEGRRNPEEVTLFKSVGVPSHDVCVALKVYEKAIASGSGCQIEMI